MYNTMLYYTDKLVTANHDHKHSIEVSKEKQKISHRIFERKLFSTGEQLSLHKHFGYFVEWAWNG